MKQTAIIFWHRPNQCHHQNLEAVAATFEVVAKLAVVENDRRQANVRADLDRRIIQDGGDRIGRFRFCRIITGIPLPCGINGCDEWFREFVGVVRNGLVLDWIVRKQVVGEGNIRHRAGPRIPPFHQWHRILLRIVDPHSTVIPRSDHMIVHNSSGL